MKLLKNPVFAVFLCLILIVGSTCLNAKIGLEKRYDKVCDELYEEMLEFSDENHLASLKVKTQSALLDGNYQKLIEAYQSELDGTKKIKDTDDVDDAIRDYNRFLRKTTKFPASFFVDLLKLTF